MHMHPSSLLVFAFYKHSFVNSHNDSAIPAKEPQHGFDAFERLLNPEGRTERWTHNWKDWDLLVSYLMHFDVYFFNNTT